MLNFGSRSIGLSILVVTYCFAKTDLNVGLAFDLGVTNHLNTSTDVELGDITVSDPSKDKLDLHDIEAKNYLFKGTKGFSAVIDYKNILLGSFGWSFTGFGINTKFLPDSIESWDFRVHNLLVSIGFGYDINKFYGNKIFGKELNIIPFVSAGLGYTLYSETINNSAGISREGNYLLDDTPFGTFGLGVNLKAFEFISIKPSICFEYRDFKTKGAFQPDGQADSIRLNLQVALFKGFIHY